MIYMKTIKNMLYIAAMATAITACSGEESLAPEANTPITVSATIPGDVWAVASRGAGEEIYSDWTLHYTNYKGEAATYSPIVSVNNGTASFTTGDDLVWAKLDATLPIHLTCKTDNGTASDATDDYTLHVSVANATPREELAFGAMKPVVAKFTVKFTMVNNLGANAEDFRITFSAYDAGEYDASTHDGVCPASSTDAVTSFEALTGTTGENPCIVTGTMLLPEQEMGNELIVTYGSHNWTVALSQVAITGTNPVQYANQLKAGQHITLNLNASLTSLGTPSIEVEAFTHGGSYDLGGEAQQPSTNP